ncbi:HNH endonuclease [Hymenobacter cellulosivorans]|uniref:HNH endonuclease n=1 Tax=Hymenobacter cellulosivorans TaxID=2932249 RepID=A0ABY4F7V9_9BACT|nr:HNH endonuclease [Hymenobacter cellulosivorans]UOQ52746.1 HNH endonuclease [Hymenobacter cellulosivorans]
MDQKVLVLNGDYTAITLCSVQKAFVLLFLDKAEMIAKSEHGVLRTISSAYPKPSIIRLQRYVRVPYKGIALSRHNIMKRDHFECQYCGSTKNLTLDHVLPRSRGGDSSWTNLLTACARCNHAKGHRTPSEAGLTIRQQPKKPTLSGFLRLSAGTIDQNWHPYLTN